MFLVQRFSIFLLVISMAWLTGCAGALSSEKHRVNTTLRVKEFNSIASEYMDRPTFVYRSSIVGGPEILLIEADAYSMYSASMGKIYRADEADLMISYIDKYLAWEKEALKHGDSLDKEIGKIKGMGGIPQKVAFYSASPQVHLLYIEACTFGMCGEDEFIHFLDHANAVELKRLLGELKAGGLKTAPAGNYQ